jgi:hypothetical protein
MNRRNQNTTNSQIAQLKRALNGSKLRPKVDPPAIVAIPWISVVVRFATGTNSGTIKVSDLLFNAQEQLRMFGTTSGTAWRVPLEFQVKTVRCWSTASDNTLEVIVFDPTNADNGTLTTLEDRGAPNHLACIGYQYPANVKNNAMYGTVESGRTLATYASSSGPVLFYYYINVRPY